MPPPWPSPIFGTRQLESHTEEMNKFDDMMAHMSETDGFLERPRVSG